MGVITKSLCFFIVAYYEYIRTKINSSQFQLIEPEQQQTGGAPSDHSLGGLNSRVFPLGIVECFALFLYTLHMSEIMCCLSFHF